MSLLGSSLFSVAGKIAVVTGGGRGIGLMITSALVAVSLRPHATTTSTHLQLHFGLSLTWFLGLQNGAKVYITSRNADACKQAAEVLSEKGATLRIVQSQILA
jgi:hypothetical protein